MRVIFAMNCFGGITKKMVKELKALAIKYCFGPANQVLQAIERLSDNAPL
jgi:hypothetical protein